MAAHRALSSVAGLMLTPLGTVGAMSGSPTAMIALFVGLILLAIGIDGS